MRAPATREYRSSALPKRPLTPGRVVHGAWAIACLCSVLVAVAVGVATTAFKLIPLAVTSGSMEPAVPVHSLIFVKEVAADDVRIGDIITFDPPGPTTRVTHRVVARERSGSRWYFQTKGDANPTTDDWRRGLPNPERYRGDLTYGNEPAIRHVATVPFAGWISVLGAVPRLRTALVLTPFALVGLALLTAIWRGPRGPRGAADPFAPASS